MCRQLPLAFGVLSTLGMQAIGQIGPVPMWLPQRTITTYPAVQPTAMWVYANTQPAIPLGVTYIAPISTPELLGTKLLVGPSCGDLRPMLSTEAKKAGPEILWLTKLIQADRYDSQAYNRRGVQWFAKASDVLSAEADFKKALELDDWNAKAHYNLAVLILRKDKTKGEAEAIHAIEHLNKAIENEPYEALYQFACGVAFERWPNHKQHAIDCYTSALSLNPGLECARERRKKLLPP
jgi:tetratricopeptide (TPR) repeat protein